MSADHQDRLGHILEAAARCQEYASHLGGPLDSMAYDAIVRNLQIVGEAAAKLSAAQRDTQPTIPWSQIVGMRNILVHEYFRADRQFVELVLSEHLPALVVAIGLMRADGADGDGATS